MTALALTDRNGALGMQDSMTARDHARSLIAFENVTVSFGGRTVIDNVSLQIRQGEFVCVVGKSGCGKTTLLRVIAGLTRPTNGGVRFDGTPHTRPRSDVAVVFQDYGRALLPWRDAAGNVSLALEAAGVPRAERRPRIAELLELTGLHNHADKFPGQLSGGMQQRLQIARCLAQRPTVLLMDEPFGALDAMTRQTLQDEILRIVALAGATVFFVTHDLEEAIYLGDRVVCMNPAPEGISEIVEVRLPKPRNQLLTREHPEFLMLRHKLYEFMERH